MTDEASDTFKACLQKVLEWEGGYSNHVRDPATKWGITRSTLSHWRNGEVSLEDVQTLTLSEARSIYKAQYWDLVQGGTLPPPLALLLFDSAVQLGPRHAVRMLQQGLDTTVDGLMGPATRAALSSGTFETVLRDLAARRALLYARSDKRDAFGLGWYRRLLDIHATAAWWHRQQGVNPDGYDPGIPA